MKAFGLIHGFATGTLAGNFARLAQCNSDKFDHASLQNITCNMWRFLKVRQPLRLGKPNAAPGYWMPYKCLQSMLKQQRERKGQTSTFSKALQTKEKNTYLHARFLPWGSQHGSGFTLRPRTVSPQVAPISRSTDSASLDALGLHGQRSSWYCRSRLIGHNVYRCNGSNDLRHQAALLNPKCNQQPGVCYIGKSMVAGGHG